MILDTAKALVSTGLASKGYNFVNIDDCWQIARDPVTRNANIFYNRESCKQSQNTIFLYKKKHIHPIFQMKLLLIQPPSQAAYRNSLTKCTR
jgi:hypothetical protein